MDGQRPIGTSNHKPRTSRPRQPTNNQSANIPNPVSTRGSDQRFVTSAAAAPPPRLGTRLRPVTNALNQRFEQHQFTADEYLAYLTERDEPNSIYRCIAASTSTQISANPAIFIRAMFPTDVVRERSFAMTDNIYQAIRSSQSAAEKRLSALSTILPHMGLRMSEGNIRVIEDFDAARDNPLLLTRNGRKLIARIIRSLFLTENVRQAFQLRNIMLSIAERTPFLEPHHMLQIASASEHNYRTIMQSRQQFATPDAARARINRFDFTQQAPRHGLLELTRVPALQYIKTGNSFADFILGHSRGLSRSYVDNLFGEARFSELSANDPLFRALFPNHIPNRQAANEPVVTYDTANAFAASYILRQSHRAIAQAALRRFGIEVQGRTAVLTRDFNRQQWPWLARSSQGEAERTLLIRILQSLNLLANNELVRNIWTQISPKLKANNFNRQVIADPINKAKPYEETPQPSAPSLQPAPHIPLPRIQPSPPVSPPSQEVIPRVELPETTPIRRPHIPSPNQPFGFQGPPVEQFYNYLTGSLFNAHLDNMFRQYPDTWLGIVAGAFPVLRPNNANLHLPTLDQEIINLLTTNTPASRQAHDAQLRLLDLILENVGIQREGDVFAARDDFSTDPTRNSLLVHGSSVSTALGIIVEHFHLARPALAKNLQALLMTLGSEFSISPFILGLWHIATGPQARINQYHQLGLDRPSPPVTNEVRRLAREIGNEIKQTNYTAKFEQIKSAALRTQTDIASFDESDIEVIVLPSSSTAVRKRYDSLPRASTVTIRSPASSDEEQGPIRDDRRNRQTLFDYLQRMQGIAPAMMSEMSSDSEIESSAPKRHAPRYERKRVHPEDRRADRARSPFREPVRTDRPRHPAPARDSRRSQSLDRRHQPSPEPVRSTEAIQRYEPRRDTDRRSSSERTHRPRYQREETSAQASRHSSDTRPRRQTEPTPRQDRASIQNKEQAPGSDRAHSQERRDPPRNNNRRNR